MRPRSIIWFERVAILPLAVGAWHLYQNWFRSGSMPSDLQRLRALSLTIYAVIVAVSLLLIWLIGRRRSTLARWLYVSLNLARVAESMIVPLAILHTRPNFPPMAGVQFTLMAIAIWLLFRPDARDWFAGRHPVDPAVFD